MHIITRSRLVEFWEKHPHAKTSLLLWYKLTFTANWQNFVQVREVFSSADQVGNLTVFNIGGKSSFIKWLEGLILRPRRGRKIRLYK